MIRKISAWTAAGLMAMPVAAHAGAQAGKVPADIGSRIEELSRELDELKSQLAKQEETIAGNSEKVDSMDKKVEGMDKKVAEKSEAWDLAARFKFHGEFRTRLDSYSADGAEYLSMTTGRAESRDYSNDSLLTNRFRLNMDVKATENISFKGRLAMYKAWGMEDLPRNDMNSWWPQFDGNSTRTPSDNALRVDRAFVNWTNIGGLPIWFSTGRRPTTDGVPSEVRLGTDKQMATPTAYMDYAFDGFVLGYEYDWGIDALGKGRIRYCFGRGFENGLQWDAATSQELSTLDDTDFTGFSWDVFEKDNRMLYVQSFVALDMFMRPSFMDDDFNALADEAMGANRTEGNIYHTTAVYENKVADLTYFVAGGWSRTDPGEHGMFNDYSTSMIVQADGSWAANPQWRPNTSSENGFSMYAGLRYDIPSVRLKVGAEYNYGSQYWISFSPGHDDMYLSKLATRGQVAELYMIYDLPAGEKLSKYAKAYIRLGYQHYWYDYTGIEWNVKPYDTDDPAMMTAAMMMSDDAGALAPIESADQVYLTFDVFF